MAEFDDQMQSEDAPVKLDRSSRIGSDAPKLITAAAIGAAVGAAVSHFLEGQLEFRGSGDEAPIRVKGGSITFELLTKKTVWEKVGGKDHWKLKDGDRAHDEYVVVLVIQDASGKLESHTRCSKKKIQIQYRNPSDPAHPGVVELKSSGKQTHLKSTHDADKETSDPPVLTYERHIERVLIDADSFEIPKDGKLESMLLLDC